MPKPGGRPAISAIASGAREVPAETARGQRETVLSQDRARSRLVVDTLLRASAALSSPPGSPASTTLGGGVEMERSIDAEDSDGLIRRSSQVGRASCMTLLRPWESE